MKRQHLFYKILTPLILASITQAVLFAFIVFLSGTPREISRSAEDRFENTLLTSVSLIEAQLGDINPNFSALDTMINSRLGYRLTNNGLDADALLSDPAIKEAFFGDIMTTLSRLVSENEAAGSFAVLSPSSGMPDLETHFDVSGVFLYAPDGDSASVVALRGYDKSISRGAMRKSVNWHEYFEYEGKGDNFDWMFAPMKAGFDYPELPASDLVYWSFPFYLKDHGIAEPFIAVSLPMRFGGETIGSYGVVYMASDILGTDRPLRSDNTSLMLASYDSNAVSLEVDIPETGILPADRPWVVIEPKFLYDIVNVNAAADTPVMLKPNAEFPGLFNTNEITYGGNNAVVAIADVPVYPADTPYYNARWVLAAIADNASVFELSNRLVTQMIVILIVALVGTLIAAALISHTLSKGLVSLLESVDQTAGVDIVPVIDDGTFEIYRLSEQLHRSSVRFKEMMSQIEDERLRYYLALMNSEGDFLDYNAVTDTLISDSQRLRPAEDTDELNDNAPAETILHNVTEHYLERVAAGEFCVRDDISDLIKFMRGQSSSAITIRFFVPNSGKSDVRYFTGKPNHIYDKATGKLLRTITCLRDITEERRSFANVFDNRRDPATGFFKSDHTASAVRDFLTERRIEEYFTVLIFVENYRYFTERYGRFYSDALITETSRAVSQEFSEKFSDKFSDKNSGEFSEENIITRECANEFMLILPLPEGVNETAVTAVLKTRLNKLSERVRAILISDEEPMRLSLCAGVFLNNTGRYVGVSKQKAEVAAAAAVIAVRHPELSAGAEPTALFSEIETDFDFTERTDVNAILEDVRVFDNYSIEAGNLSTFAFNILEKTSDMKSAVQILITRIGHEFDLSSVKVFVFDRNGTSFSRAWMWQKSGETPAAYNAPVTAADRNAFDKIMYGTDYLIIDRETMAYPTFFTNGLCFGSGCISAVIPCPTGETFFGCVAFEAAPEVLEKADFDQLRSLVKLLTAFMTKQLSTNESRAKSEFLSKMSHEIRTPMNAILGMTDIALSDKELTKAQEGYLKKIEYSAKYLLTLINDILDMSRIESGKTRVEITDADMDEIMLGLQSIIGTQCETKGITYTVNDNVPVRKFKTDILKLNQILLNLLGNAVKFTPRGGEITLSVSLSGGEDETAASHNIEFIVKDTGIGIRKERLQKIFEPFEQADESTIRQYGGTGLGLPISSSYIALLGGQMEIESEPGMGTTFTFTIPVTVTPIETRGNEAADGKQVNLSGRRILIAEDDELNMEIAQTLLEKSGFAVEGAENGRVAVDKFCASKPGYYDAILMDIRMPVLDGLAAAAEIRACDHPDAKSITILALSANAFAEDVKISKQAGMNDHIIKPLDMRVLLKKLEEFLQ